MVVRKAGGIAVRRFPAAAVECRVAAEGGSSGDDIVVDGVVVVARGRSIGATVDPRTAEGESDGGDRGAIGAGGADGGGGAPSGAPAPYLTID